MADVTGAPGTDARREQAQLVERVEAHIDQLFERLTVEWGLTRGDLSPLQSLRLHQACEAIAAEVEQWREQNRT
jgi:hypothetical protein